MHIMLPKPTSLRLTAYFGALYRKRTWSWGRVRLSDAVSGAWYHRQTKPFSWRPFWK
jgi:hypothetical protein